ncbi:MAG: PAS domain S-box protein [Bryobacteraceae bacterium]
MSSIDLQWNDSLKFAPLGTVVLNRSGRIIFANDAALSLLRFSQPSELVGVKFRECVDTNPGEGRTGFAASEILSHSSPLRMPLCLRRGDSSTVRVTATAWNSGIASEPTIYVCLEHAEVRSGTDRDAQLRARLLDEIQEAVFTWEFGSAIGYWNRAAERLYGYSAAEACGQVSHELLKTSAPNGISSILSFLAREKQWTGELTHQTKRGNVVIVESHMVVVEDNGRLIVLESNRDITRGNAAERALRNEQLLSRGIISQAVDSIFVIDRDGFILSANPEAERVFGWHEGELVGRNLHATLHHHYPSGDDYPVTSCPINSVHLSGEPIRGVELVFFRKDGSTVDVSCSNVPLTLGSERIGAALIIRDISHRKTMEKALVESEERLRVAVASAKMGTWDYNPVTKTGRWDAQCKRSFGLPPASSVTFGDFARSIHPDDRGRVADSVRQALDPKGDGRFAAEFRTIGPADHRLRHTEARGQAFFGKVGEKPRAIRFIGTVADITSQKRSEEALRRANEDLRQFAYAAAHDLQEPLRNVVNLLGLYKRTSPDEYQHDGDELIDESIDDARRMHRMVQDLLSFTKVSEAGAIVPSSTDSGEVLREVMRGLAILIEEAGATVVSRHLPTINMQPTHLTQLFQNLITNALKYRRPDVQPTIEVSAAKTGREWTFAVADNGIGFDPIYAQRIFGVFKRLHGRNEYPGSGIGLAICSRILSLYGGRIWAQGRPGAGATFFFTAAPAESKK